MPHLDKNNTNDGIPKPNDPATSISKKAGFAIAVPVTLVLAATHYIGGSSIAISLLVSACFGVLIGLIGRSVTARIVAQERARFIVHSSYVDAHHFDALTKHSPDGILVHIRGRIVLMNDKAARMLGGTSANEFIGLLVTDFVHPDSIDVVQERMAQVSEGRVPAEFIKETLYDIHGDTLDVDVSSVPVNFHGQNGAQVTLRDASLRMEIEADLSRSRQDYRFLVEHIGDMVVKIDSEDRFQFVSPSYCRVFGKTEDELLGTSYEPLIHEDDLESTRTAMQALHHPPHTCRLSHRTLTADGWRWFSWSASAIVNNDGTVVSIVGVGRDIHERKQLERRLETDRRRLEALVNDMPVIVDALDEDGNITLWNRAAERITGYSAKEIVGNPDAWALLYPDPEYRKKMVTAWHQTRSGYRDWEWNITCKDGSTRIISWTDVSSESPIPGWHNWAIGTDVTERRQAQDALRTSEARYRALVEQSNDAIYRMRDGSYEFVNDRFVETFGYSREELLSPDFDFRVLVAPESLGMIEERLRKQAAGEPQSNRYELVSLTKDGRKIDLEISVSHVQLDGYQVTQGIVRDISRRKTAERALRASEQRFRSVFECSPLGIHLWELVEEDTLILREASPTGDDILGIPHGSLCGLTFEECFPWAEGNGSKEQYLEVARTGATIAHEGLGGNPSNPNQYLDIVAFQTEPSKFAVMFSDVTEQRETMDALHASEERMKLALAGSLEGTWDWDLQTDQLTFYESSTARKVGNRPAPPDDVVENVSQFNTRLHPDDRASVSKAMADHLDGKTEYYEAEYRAPGLDGDWRWSLDRGKVVERDNDGKPLRMVGTHRDIHHLKKVEQELLQSQRSYKNLLSNLPGMAYRCSYDDNWTMQFISDGCTDLLAYDADELIGNRSISYAEVVHPDDRENLRDQISPRVNDNRPFELRYRVIRQDGEIRWVWEQGRGIRDDKGSVEALEGLIMDITDLVQAEEALRESEKKFRDTAELLPEAIVEMDLDGRIIFANQKVVEYFGYSKEELNGQVAIDLLLEPEHRKPAQTVIRQLVQGDASRVSEYEARRKDGTTFPISTHSGIVRRRDEVVGVRTIVVDITERRRHEANQLKTEKLESVGVLAGGIAHDFNNLLTGILGNISLAALDDGISDEIAERLREAEAATIRAKDLTKQLLTFSKGGEPVKRASSITSLISDCTAFVLHGSNVRPRYQLAPNLPSVYVDPGQISQVLHNLVLNADQAMPDGGTISITAETVEIASPNGLDLREGTYVEVVIRDTGSGISPDHLHRIFDPYFTTKSSGTGLGLASCYSIIKKHNGHIVVESVIGEGTTFTLYLPAINVTPDSPDECNTCPAHGKGSILVMDDEEFILDLSKRILEKLGYTVTCARSGEEAISTFTDALTTAPFDVVILDLTVPGGMGGKDAMKRLREIAPDVTAIVSSGYSNDPVMASYHDFGFKAVVTKPYRATELGQVVGTLLTRQTASVTL